AAPQYAKATKMDAPISLDGALTEWDQLHRYVPLDGDARSPYFLVQWDDENLYVAVNAPALSLGAGVGLTDRFDVFIDSKNTRSPALYRAGDTHLSFLRFGAGQEIARYVTHYSEEGAPPQGEPSVAFRSSRVGDRYVFEAKIPKASVLPLWTGTHRSLFGLNMILSTRDGRKWAWATENPLDPPIRWRAVQLIGSVRADVIFAPQPPDADLAFRPLPSDTFEAGDDLWLLVRDPDANRHRDQAETVRATLIGDLTGERRDIELREVNRGFLFERGVDDSLSTDSEFFAATITTIYGDTPSNEAGVIAVHGSERLTLTYDDTRAFPDERPDTITSSATARIGTTGELLITDGGEPVRLIRSGDTLTIRVADADLIREIAAPPPPEPSPPTEGEPPPPPESAVSMARSFSIRLTAKDADAPPDDPPTDALSVTLVEVEEGVFEVVAATEYGEVPIPDDETLQVVGTQSVEATYIDRLQESGQTRVPMVKSARVEIGATARLRIRAPGGTFPATPDVVTPVLAGKPLIVRLEDADLNVDPNAIDEVSVTVTTDALNDSLTLTLLEIAPDSGAFEALVYTMYSESGEPENDRIDTLGNEVISFRFLDAIQGSGATNVSVTVQAVTQTGFDGDLEIVRTDSRNVMTHFNAEDTLSFRLVEGDATEGELLVRVRSRDTGDDETVSLNPVGDTGQLYAGTLSTAFAVRGVANDGVLQVAGNDRITATYTDALRASGETDIVVSTSATTNTGNDAEMVVFRENPTDKSWYDLTEAFIAGESLVIEVTDPDLNARSEVIEQTLVTLTEDFLGDTLDVTLRETSGNSGVFRGVVTTRFGTEAASDNQLQVHGQSLVQIRYLDAIRASG
ncbi:MAG: hypothetical protein O3A46_17565, partial [Candidatus Poribacteria bacterium]|nr:hypothetical protein [Candidatus Poribacteria bacterium]